MKQITFYFVLKFETDLELGASQIPCMQLQHCDCNCEERNLLASRAARARALAMPPQTDQMQYSPSSQRQNMPVVIIPIKLGTSYGI